MATGKPKVQLGAEFDATGARTGFEEVKQGAREMAQSVKQSGQDASRGLDGIGTGADASAKKVDNATKSLIGSIQRTTAAQEAGSRSSADYYRVLASQRGVDISALKPYLDQLDAVTAKQRLATQALGSSNAALGTVGVSAAQTAAALRGVPAQFTDIITSLQGGQNAFTVFLQQGGQLKDMFGGAGNAAKALGGYVAGLVGPFTVATALAAGLALAYFNGAQEASAYSKAIILSGNAAGTTSGQLAVYAQNIAKVTGTQGSASAALAEFVSQSRVGTDNLQQFTQAALQFEKAAGQSVATTVKQFSELGKSPVEASIKLNEQYGYLTASVYQQIKALQEQGRTTEAADLAQKTFANTIEVRSTQIMGNLGTIERGWNAIKKAITGAADAASNIGRGNTPAGELSSAQKDLQDRLARGPLNDTAGAAASFEKGNEGLRTRIAYLSEAVRLENRTAEEQARQAVLQRTLQDFDKSADQFESNASKRDKEIAKAKTDGQALILAGLKTEKDLRDQIAGINEKYKDKSGAASGGQSEVAAITARTIAQKLYLEQLRAQGAEATKLTDGEKLVIKIKEELGTSITGVARAEKVRALAAAEGQAIVDKQVAGELRRIAGLERSKTAYEALIDQTTKSATALGTQADELEASNKMWGQGRVAIEQYRLALVNAKLAEVEGGSEGSYDPAYVAALRLKSAEQQRLVTQAQVADYKTLNQQAQEYARTVEAEASVYADEARLAGLTAVERSKILAVRKVDLEVAKQIAAIDRSGATESDKQALRDSVNATALQDKQVAVAKVVADEWTKTSDSINQSLTDALLRGFESGKSFAVNLRDTVVNMFKTMVLRPVISAVLSPVSQLLSSGAQALTGGSNIFSTVSTATRLYNAASSLSTVATQLVSGSMSLANAAGTLYANASGTGISGLLATNGAYGTAAGGTAAAGGASAGFGAIPVVGWIAAGMLAANSLYGKGFSAATIDTKNALGTGYGLDVKLNTQFLTSLGISDKVANIITGAPIISKITSYFSGESRGGGQYTTAGGATKLVSGPDGGEIAGSTVQAAIDTTVSGINDLFKTLGSTASVSLYNSGLESSKNGKGFTYAGGTLSDGTKFGEQKDDPAGILHYMNNRGSKTSEEALQQFSLELQQTTIQALQAATDIPKTIQDQLKGVDANALDAAGLKTVFDALNATISAVKTFQAQFEALPFENLKNLGFDAASSLIAAAGGLDALNTSVSSYYENFYTEAERNANTLKNLTASFATLGLALPTTRDGFRDLVSAQNLATESGRTTYTTLLSLQTAFASVVPAGQTAAEALAAAALALQETRKAALDAVTASASTAYSALDRASSAQSKALQATVDVAAEQVRAIQGVFDAIGSNVTALYGQVESTTAGQAAKGQEFIAQALATVQTTGYLPDSEALSSAITAARAGIDSTRYGSKFESDLARLSLAGSLSQIQAAAGTQLTSAEKALGLAQSQVDALGDMLTLAKKQLDAANGIDVSVKSVAEALSGFNASILALAGVRTSQGLTTSAAVPGFASGGFHAGGLRLVGEGGAELEATGPARIWNASETRSMLSGAGDSDALLAEIRALREDNRAQASAIVGLQRRISKIVERWDGQGMPQTRELA